MDYLNELKNVASGDNRSENDIHKLIFEYFSKLLDPPTDSEIHQFAENGVGNARSVIHSWLIFSYLRC